MKKDTTGFVNSLSVLYLRIESYFFYVSLKYEISGKLHLICMKTFGFMLKLDVI